MIYCLQVRRRLALQGEQCTAGPVSRVYRRPSKLNLRLQTGMNLQVPYSLFANGWRDILSDAKICFRCFYDPSNNLFRGDKFFQILYDQFVGKDLL